MKLSKNAIKVLEKRYLFKEEGALRETPDEMFRRVAKFIASADIEYNSTTMIEVKEIEDTFYNLMSNLEFLPNSPTLMNAGRPLGQLAGCFVLPIDSNPANILATLSHAALIHKSGGGTGFNFTNAISEPVLDNYKPNFLIDDQHQDSILIHELKLLNASIFMCDDTDLSRLDKKDVYYIEDNMESIFDLQALFKIPKYIVFSNIRPQGRKVLTTSGVASGPISFMKVWDQAIGFLNNPITPVETIKLFDIATQTVKQGGTRRGR